LYQKANWATSNPDRGTVPITRTASCATTGYLRLAAGLVPGQAPVQVLGESLAYIGCPPSA
jgi:hypothetical protein